MKRISFPFIDQTKSGNTSGSVRLSANVQPAQYNIIEILKRIKMKIINEFLKD
jgi:hypothetical protein